MMQMTYILEKPMAECSSKSFIQSESESDMYYNRELKQIWILYVLGKFMRHLCKLSRNCVRLLLCMIPEHGN